MHNAEVAPPFLTHNEVSLCFLLVGLKTGPQLNSMPVNDLDLIDHPTR